MSREKIEAPADNESVGRRPYSSPRLTVFGDMKSLTATGTKPGEEGGDEDPAFLRDSPFP
jgi:hypothetical protein